MTAETREIIVTIAEDVEAGVWVATADLRDGDGEVLVAQDYEKSDVRAQVLDYLSSQHPGRAYFLTYDE